MQHEGSQLESERWKRWYLFQALQVRRLILLEGCGAVFKARLQRLRSMV